jgi:hypothetical protein
MIRIRHETVLFLEEAWATGGWPWPGFLVCHYVRYHRGASYLLPSPNQPISQKHRLSSRIIDAGTIDRSEDVLCAIHHGQILYWQVTVESIVAFVLSKPHAFHLIMVIECFPNV